VVTLYGASHDGGMRTLVQRVGRASVTVSGEVVGSIGSGLCVLVGVTHTDDHLVAARLADKVWHLRIFDDDDGIMNCALADLDDPQVLCVSQFTLYGDTSRGRRPSWIGAAPGPVAEPLVQAFATRLQKLGATVATGRFGAAMEVQLVNEGPVTLMLELDADG
jgi:D-tyrosyl-tRNA(Tyr) deacylase